MIIQGKAIKLDHKRVVSPCGFDGLVGYRDDDGRGTRLSFMPKTHKVQQEVTTLTVDGKPAKVINSVPSKYISGMWTFFIKYGE